MVELPGGEAAASVDAAVAAVVESWGQAFVQAAGAAQIGISIVLLDREARVRFITDVGVSLLGQPREIILGRPAHLLLTPDEQAERLTRAPSPPGSGGPRTFETTAVAADGRHIPLEVSVSPTEIVGKPALIAFFRDITPRRRSLEELHRAQRRMSKVLEFAPDAIWINDGTRLLYVNPATIKLLGYDSAAELHALDPQGLVHPDDRAAMGQRSMQMMRSGQSLPPREYRVRHRDGHWILTEVHSTPIEWEGRPAIMGFARDITARKEMELHLMRTDRMAALGTLLAGIAHEMNNPLTFVTLGVDHARRLLGRLHPAPAAEGHPVRELEEVLNEIGDGVERVAGIVRQLRESSRIDPESRTLVDLGEVLRSALRLAQNELRHQAKLILDISPGVFVKGAARRLEQVFLNLLVNAAHAVAGRGSDSEVRVSLGLLPNGPARVTVSDNGPGVAPAHLGRLFDPFFTTKPVGLGTGLGLSICHGIVTAHGGQIGVRSTPGHGATFWVELPVEAAPPAASPEPAPPPAKITSDSPTRPRILVVDDESTLCHLVKGLLHDRFEVSTALDARAALALLSDPARTFDVVLCDLMMPGMTGMELYRVAVAEAGHLADRFVFMTGGAFTQGSSSFLQEGRVPLLEKPFTKKSLEEALAARLTRA